MMANRIMPLEIRGFSRGNSELLRPLPEKPEEPLPLSYVETVKEAISSFYMSEDSACSTPTRTHCTDMSGECSLNESLHSESSHAWSTSTGTMTGRSSVYSWGNDNEFDRKAAASVQRMFEEIDNMLYEGNDLDGGEPLLSECEEWCSRFPHLRIRGVQVLPSKDNGTEFVALADDDPRVYDHRPQTAVVDMESEDIAAYMTDFQRLSIQGNSVEPQVQDDDISDIDSHEEIFAEDGCVEEYLAYDCSSSSEDLKKKAKDRCHMGYPPVTPNAVATDTILYQVFDQLWGEIIIWLKDLLRLYSQNVLREEQPFIPCLMKASETIDSQPMTRDVFAHTYQVRLRSGIQPSDVDRLNDLITIRSLPLKQRSSLYESREGTPVCQTRPGSSNIVMSRPSMGRTMSWRSSEHHISSRMSSARTLKRNPSLRLQPIDRSKTPALQESDMIGEGVRGTKLVPGTDRLPSPNATSPVSPQLWGGRNGTLPPIDKPDFLESSGRPRGSAKMKVHFNLRAASAATDDSRKSLKERGGPFADSRPNTTHSFRPGETSAMSTRRFSTPMGTLSGQSSQLRPAGSFGYSGHSMVTGITGVSMPISSYHPSVEHGVHGHQQLYYHMEGSSLAEENEELDNTSQWGQYQPNSIGPRRGRQNSSIR